MTLGLHGEKNCLLRSWQKRILFVDPRSGYYGRHSHAISCFAVAFERFTIRLPFKIGTLSTVGAIGSVGIIRILALLIQASIDLYMHVTLYHNPRCSKSREALALLHARGLTPEVVLYLETPPDSGALNALLTKLQLPARALLRSKETEYTELGLDDPSLSEARIIEAICQHPRLLERPIAVAGDRAVIGRPPEAILALFE